jgi:hypothetical protein
MRLGVMSILAAAGLCVMSAGIRADALDPATLPSNTKWLMHLDMDAIMKSDVLSGPMRDLLQEHHFGQHQGHHSGFLAGIRIPDDLHDITIFGTGYDNNSSVTLVQIAAQQTPIDQTLQNRPGVQTISYDDQKIFSFHTSHGDVYESFPKPTEILNAHSLDAIKQELDVLGTKIASLGADSNLMTDNTSGLFFYASGTGLDQLGRQHAARSPFLSQIDDGWLACTQKGSNLLITGQFTALSEKSAVLIQQSLQGMAATAELAQAANENAPTQPSTGAILNVAITSSGRDVQINCEAPPDFWLNMIPKPSGPPGPPPGPGPGH